MSVPAGQAPAACPKLGDVNTIVVRRAKDGKDYPLRPLTRQERGRIRVLTHQLIHRDHLSIRQAQRVMLESYHVRRSVGSIMRDLTGFECPACAT